MWLLAMLVTAARADTWTVAVWMDGDNDLERYVVSDLDELERAVGPDVRILVQADRIEGHDPRDGDWTGTRRYEIVADRSRRVVSPVLEDLGEVDMGSEAELADFLLWADATAPADHVVVVLWNHGGGFWIASDETDHDRMSLDGELQAGLQPLVDARGAPIDVVAFDACNMGEWEVAHALRGLADVVTASEATVGGHGLEYDEVFPFLPVDADAAWVGEALAHSAHDAGELTWSTVDLRTVDALSDAVDALADAYLARADGLAEFADARHQARGVALRWPEFWLDLGSLADEAATSADLATADAARAVRTALADTLIANDTQPITRFASGLTIYTDTSEAAWVEAYASGPWDANDWPTLLRAVRAAGL
ncbi:MAG: hypothetical protein H6734_27680 [Alphaproteobacteria bacterium]|nr:hypothetical protein [Alphaproteobacteria bacterium]MCB9688113.1 hypothetical protein [Alphaproteobacteria bacterium]